MSDNQVNDEISDIKADSSVDAKTKGAKTPPKPKKKKKKMPVWRWTVYVFALTLAITFAISLATETVMETAHIAVAIVVLFLIILINLFFDVVGTAFASGDISPFLSMSSRKIKGAKMCVTLLKNADKVINICSDVIGDVCGVVSGGAGAIIAITLSSGLPYYGRLLTAISVSSVIAALIVGGKGMLKSIAVTHSHKIIMFVGRILSVFAKDK